jgi:murein DD-endopeptidase MepM/ murein hydrolase activator NlpD
MKLIYPIEIKGTKTSGFGYRVHPVKGTKTHHNGIDLGVPDGTGINSVAEGEVVRSDMNNYRGYGNLIIIKHDIDGETFYSAYAHLTKRLVEVGDKVKKGEKIALSGGGQGLAGGGGLSTGPHLHFEIRKSMNGDWVNPEPFINDGEIVKDDLKPETKEKEKPLSSLVVTYENLSGDSKKLVDSTISKLKTLGVTNPYSIVVICSIILDKYGLLTEKSFSKKLLGSNNVNIPADGAHKGQSGWQSNNAWDIKSPIGGPVYAVADGTLATFNDYGPSVIKKNGKKLFGQGFTVNSDNGLPDVYYTHLKDSVVGKGDKVTCGQLLGYVMDFPGSSYDHLHIGVETGNIKQFINDDGTLKCKSTESDDNNSFVLPDFTDDLENLTKDKDKINNFKSLDDAIDYFSKIELSDGTMVSNTNIKNNTKKFKIGPQKLNMSQSDMDAFFKGFLNIAKIGGQKRKDLGFVDENQQLKEEVYRINDLIKKIL